VVVLAWLAGNVVLIAVLFGFGESLVGELLYLCSSLPVLAFALAVGVKHRGEGEVKQQIALPAGTGYSAAAAIGSLLVGLGLIFAYWITIVGGLMVLWAGLKLWRARPASPVLEEQHD
jgi:hypothetical protein